LSDIFLDQLYGGVVSGNLSMFEAARTVIEVECPIIQVAPSKALGRVNFTEAHSNTGNPLVPAQKEEACEGCIDLSGQGVVGPTGVVSNEVIKSGMEVCADSLNSERNEGEAAHQGNCHRNLSSSGLNSMKMGCVDQ